MKNFFLFVLFFLIISFFIYTEENKIEPIFIFSGSQGFSGEADSGKAKFLNLEHDIFTGLEIPISFYTFGFWAQDSLIFDFADMHQDETFRKMINNSLSTGIDSTFFFKNIIYTGVNFYLSYSLPFNQYKTDDYTPSDDMPFLLLNPLIKIGGMYYFGLDWEIEQDFSVKLIFNTNSSTFKPTTNFALSYEMFRFYGPKDFTIQITLNDSIGFSFPISSLLRQVYKEIDEEENEEDDDSIGSNSTIPANTFINSLSFGLDFNFYDVSISISFMNNIYYNMSSHVIGIKETGFSAGVSYTIKLLTFSGSYTGYLKNTDSYIKWVSNFEFSLAVNFSSIDLKKNEKK